MIRAVLLALLATALSASEVLSPATDRRQAAERLRQIVLVVIAASSEETGFPASLQALAEDLPAKMLTDPGHPRIAAPFLYVRPAPSPKATQPVLLRDPDCDAGVGSVVCYADGHTAFVAGTALWTAAKRLAALPKAARRGIEAADWPADPPPAPGR
jgi:hypothetical protein